MRAPVGHACTHSPQATQVLIPMGSSKSKTILDSAPRPAMPMTSLTWTSRQARTQRVQWMQASRLTVMAGWLASVTGAVRAGKRRSMTSIFLAQSQNREPGACAASGGGWAASSISNTMSRADLARSDEVRTVMPSVGWRMQLAASTRSPSISTMQARQLPAAR